MISFYILSAIAVAGAIRTVTNSNPVHGLLSLIVCLLALAGLFFFLGAPFAGALEILVYAGAILVLFVFVVMMLNLGQHTILQEKKWLTSSAIAVPAMLSIILGLTVYWMFSSAEFTGKVLATQTVDAKAVGISLFGEYVLVVEFASLLLTTALVAAYHLGKRPLTELQSKQVELEHLNEERTHD